MEGRSQQRSLLVQPNVHTMSNICSWNCGAEDTGRVVASSTLSSTLRLSVFVCWTHSGRLSCRASRLGHLPQDLVTIAGGVSCCLDLLLAGRLTVHIELDAGGRNHYVELLWRREEIKK